MPLRTSLTPLLSLTLALAAAPALAQDRPVAPPEGRPSMEARELPGDTDGDGVLTRAESEAHAAQRFAERDADGNGTLNADELRGPGGRDAPRRRAGGLGPMDANGDGAIDRTEFVASALMRFDRIDADRDGRVTPEERRAAREAMRARWQSMRDPGRDGGPPPMPQD